MNIQDLYVYHTLKTQDCGDALASSFRADAAFRLETCQRILYVSLQPLLVTPNFNGQAMHGTDAYCLLLRVAAGLESQVKGETDVFGQIKEAWQKFLEQNTVLGCELSPWMQRLFEDTKEVRAQHLQKMGAPSYGSLLRKLLRLKRREGKPVSPVLLVGAGQISRSVVAWLEDLEKDLDSRERSNEIWIYNRGKQNLALLLQDLERARGKVWVENKVRVLETEQDEIAAWEVAAHIVVGVPPNVTADALRVAAFLKGDPSRTVVHLGGQKHELRDTAWDQVTSFFTLTDLFGMMQEQGIVRDAQFTRAEKACDQRARLRGISSQAHGSVSLAHGWEDLAVFA